MRTSVIIPVYNNWQLTADCLRSLREHTPAAEDLEVLVVDNASSDETRVSAPVLGAELFGDAFRYLRQDENRNFGPACNIGALAASGELLFFLNNDTILTPEWLPPLREALLSVPRLGAVGPLLLHPGRGAFPDRVQHLGVHVTPDRKVHHLYEGISADCPLAKKTRFFKILTAAAVLIPASVFAEAGGFHPEYRNGFEDVDLSLELHKRGYRLMCQPKSRVYHLVGQSSGRHAHESYNAQLLFRRQARHLLPDMLGLVRQDGYELRLNSVMWSTIELPERRKRMIEKNMAGCEDTSELHAILAREPFWYPGYHRIAQLEQERGNLDMAYATLNLCATFNSNLEICKLLFSLAKLRGDETGAQSFAQWIENHYGATFRITGQERKRLEALIRVNRSEGAAEEAEMIQDWLDKRTVTAAAQHTASA